MNSGVVLHQFHSQLIILCDYLVIMMALTITKSTLHKAPHQYYYFHFIFLIVYLNVHLHVHKTIELNLVLLEGWYYGALPVIVMTT